MTLKSAFIYLFLQKGQCVIGRQLDPLIRYKYGLSTSDSQQIPSLRMNFVLGGDI